MADLVFSSPQAYITIDSKPAGYLRNISWSEAIQRVSVRGLGRLGDKERPAVGWSGNVTIDEMFIDLSHPSTQALINRVGGNQNFFNTLTMGGVFNVDIIVFGKITSSTDQVSKLVTGIDKESKTVAKIGNFKVENQSWNLSDGSISGLNTSGSYLNPVVQEL